MIRLYVALDLAAYQDQHINLPEAPVHHLLKVLRAKLGTDIVLFDGAGQSAQAKISEIRRDQVQVKIESVLPLSAPSPLKVHLGFALAKREHFEIALQKSVELGVAFITPLITERSMQIDPAQLSKKMARWQSIIISACEQSGNNFLPTLYSPQILSQWLQGRDEALRWVLHPGAQTPALMPDQAISHAAILIGPEGGFSHQEIEQAKVAQFSAVHLGTRVLRTETAPLVALTLLQYQYGDLKK